ncbi:MAG: exodeoxyribonuclease VII large subunit [Propionibacteriaceae bacterium]|nr:exodeoxyribonuclease VII large subunit [Propionibacteriaceae bacterium]
MTAPVRANARPGATPEAPTSLSTVVGLVKGWVERCGWVWVEAQVIELRRRAAPTQFLTLRDTSNQTSATITCPAAVLDAAGPVTEGMTVLARLHPRVWADRASLSFECSQLRIAGEGQLLAQLEALKRKLAAEGLFDPRRKVPLPVLPRGIGLITGADSAAERDVVTNVRLRWPQAVIITRHVLVQGPECAGQVMRALAELDADPAVDVIVIARGGGALEDLLPFSDEGLVRAVAACRTPVVSAIGHEVDTPIIDLAADLRASTPTDAAKRIVPDAAVERQGLAAATDALGRAISRRLDIEQRRLDDLRSRPVLRNPSATLIPHEQALATARLRLSAAIQIALRDQQARLDRASAALRTLSPQATLERGYAIVTSKDAVLTDASAVGAGDHIDVRLARGGFGATIDGAAAASPPKATRTRAKTATGKTAAASSRKPAADKKG